MKEKISALKGDWSHSGQGQQYPNMQASPGSKIPSSGITQPHSAKKEALGPNTKR